MRLGRRIVQLLAAASLLLFLAACILKVRGHYTQSLITRVHGGTRVHLHFRANGLVWTQLWGWPTSEPLSWRSGPADAPGFGVPGLFEGKLYTSRTVFPGIIVDEGPSVLPNGIPLYGRIVVIDWGLFIETFGLVGLAFGIPAVTGIVRHRHRSRTGRCIGCGYDLRSSPERCPECGAVSPSPSA